MRRRARHLLLLALLPGLLPVPGPVAAQDARTNPGRLAVVLFLSAEDLQHLALPLAEIRSLTTTTLAEHFAGAGYQVVAPEDIDRAVGRWRVRDERSLNRTFLNHMQAELGAGRLLVAHLHVRGDGLSLRTRLLDLPDGLVRRIQWPVIAATLDADEPDPLLWRDRLDRICRTLDTSEPSALDGPVRLLLPADPVGCQPEQAMAATCAILQEWMRADGSRFPDPALVYTRLADEGVHPARLAAAGRRLLREEFHTDELWRPILIAYGASTRDARQAFFEEGITATGRRLPDFDLNLRRIDLASGLVLSGGSIYAPSAAERGWFGHQNQSTLKERIERSVARLRREHFTPKERQR